MVSTDGSSPAQKFFNRTQKQNLPSLNPNAKPFEPDTLLKKKDKLHEQRIKRHNQHSVIIKDLAPGQEELTQDYLSGLWSDSAIVLSKREDGRSYWVKDKQGRTFIQNRRHLKAISLSKDSSEKHLLILPQFQFQFQFLPSTCSTTTGPFKPNCIGFHLQLFVRLQSIHYKIRKKNLCITQASVSSTLLTSSSLRNVSIQLTSITLIILGDLHLTCNTTSSHRKLYFNANPMVSLLDLLYPRDLFGAKTQSPAPRSAQAAQGKNIQEVSYQEGSKDNISHT